MRKFVAKFVMDPFEVTNRYSKSIHLFRERGAKAAMDKFELVSPYKPTGDQPEAIKKLTEGVQNGLKEQVLLGVTGSGASES